jgi:ubiquinone/menaquinone biosynthesis C-methylase UbiE
VRDARWFARFATDTVVRWPVLWRLLRSPLRSTFDALAPTWESRIGVHHLWALDLALADVSPPRRVLDLGTGTGVVARALAERYAEADVLGIDLSPAMVTEAGRALPAGLLNRVRFEVGDAADLAYEDGTFELVVLSNMIPFFGELARITAPGGRLVISFSRGAQTPIYVPSDRLRHELGQSGFAEIAEFSAPPATALRAARR